MSQRHNVCNSYDKHHGPAHIAWAQCIGCEPKEGDNHTNTHIQISVS